jgi:hypothetical protein
MSIIHDALKKTQANLNNNNEPKKSPEPNMNSSEPNKSEHNTPQEMQSIYDKLHKKPEPIVPPPTKNNPGKSAKKTAARQENSVMNFLGIILCILIISGAIWFIYEYYSKDLGKKGMDFKKVLNFKPKKLNFGFGTKSKNSKPLSAANNNLPPGAIILNGITSMGDKRVALINNEIYQVGETIEGKKITDISMEKVELVDSNGNVTTLKVKGY